MKKIIICFACLVSSMPVQSQTAASIKWSSLEPTAKGVHSHFFGSDDNAIYLETYRNSEKQLRRISKALDAETEFKFEAKDNASHKEYKLERFVFLNDGLFVLKSAINKESRSKELYIEEVDKITMKSSGVIKKVAEISRETDESWSDYAFKVSPEHHRLLITKRESESKDKNTLFKFIVIGPNAEVQWKKNIELPYDKPELSDNNFSCDENGNVYFTGRIISFGKKTEAMIAAEGYYLFAVGKYGEAVAGNKISLAEKVIQDFTYAVKKNGDIIMAGFYAKQNGNSRDGVFTLTFDPFLKTVKDSSFEDIPLDIVTQGAWQEKFFSYRLSWPVVSPDEKILVTGEQYCQETYNFGSKGTYDTKHKYYHNHIIAVDINPSGKIAWMQIIPKKQYTKEDEGAYYSFYNTVVSNEKMHFIYCDDKSNLAIKDQSKLKAFELNSRDGILISADIDNNGQLTREEMNPDKEDILIHPEECRQLPGTGQLFIIGEKNGREQFGIAAFN
jgi:hypothetical protein